MFAENVEPWLTRVYAVFPQLVGQAGDIIEGVEVVDAVVQTVHAILMAWSTGQQGCPTAVQLLFIIYIIYITYKSF